MSLEITTAVFPVAGLGTRFLPVTKAGPKEMLPLVDKPLIQYVVEEAIAAGVRQLVFVTSNTKRAIEDYFDRHYEFESYLAERGQKDALSIIRNIVPDHVNVVYVRQPKPLGLGDAVLRAKYVVGDNPFAVLLADDIINHPQKACLQSMVELFSQTHASVLAVKAVPKDKINRYGVVGLDQIDTENQRVVQIVEKPAPEVAPSNLAVIGRYILTPDIFSLLESTSAGVGGEIQLTDAIAKLLKKERVTAFPIQGQHYDCGSKLGFLEATIVFALQRPELSESLRNVLSQLIER